MPEDIAIRVRGVAKNFKLPHEKINSIKSLVVNPFKQSKSYENQHALEDVSFQIKKGEFFGIVGRNGSGKSTLLKILAGIYQPTKGTVDVNGKLVPFIELGVGFNPELSGRENVYLNGALLGFSKEEVTAKYDDIVAFSELERFMDQKLKNYSSGMQVRLAFAVAIIAEADILLVDEVLAVGDADFQKKCFSYFRQLKKQKKTVVFVSHDMNAVREYCDKAVLIEKGEIAASGLSEDVAKEYMRLFMPEAFEAESRHPQATQGRKWGLGGVDITTVKPHVKVLDTDIKELKIILKFKATGGVTGPVVPGFTIKNESGEPVCGTNSKILQRQVELSDKGEEVVTEWTVPNVFNEGVYFIEPAIARASDMDMYQWWDNAVTFEVVNEFKTPYPIAPQIKLKVVE